MKTEIERSIKVLTQKIQAHVDAGDALKLTQSSLNLAHTLMVLKQIEILRKE